MLVIAAACCLAWMSWKYVEVPMRQSGAKLAAPRVFLVRFATPLIALFLVTGITAYSGGFPTRFDTRVSQLERMVAARPEELRAGCHVPTAMYETLPKNSCVLGAKKNEVDGLLIGDSFANHFTGMIDVMARSQGLSLMDYTMDGCPPILDYDNGKGSSYASKCLQRNREAYGFISAKHYKHVILAGSWPDTREAGEKLAKSVETLLQQGTMLTLIVNNESIAHGASCPIRRIMYKSAEPCNGTRHGAPKYIASIISKHPTVRVVDPNVVICSTTSCSPLINDKILYRDDVHLNDVGSREIGRELLTLGVLL
jgi:hypothetical protein